MINYKGILTEYLNRTGFKEEDLIKKSKDRRLAEGRYLLWLILRSSSPLVRLKDIVEFMNTIGHKTTVANVQQGLKKIKVLIRSKDFKAYAKIYDSFLDDV